MTGRVDAIRRTESPAGASPRNAVDSSTTSDANMAWLLAIAADACLTGHERMMTFVELGSGEGNLAIQRILNAVMSSGMALPVAIIDRLARWLDGYVGSSDEPQLRAILAEIQARQFQPVPFRIRQARGAHTPGSVYSANAVCRKHA
ncbi:tryptophanase [Mycobacterium sp. NPDC048908]|uniref:tryptophanase n=1 Tax=Mycobacterium sp. NPDC048908 TaxID=3364292 RepID=UPI0037190C9B